MTGGQALDEAGGGVGAAALNLQPFCSGADTHTHVTAVCTVLPYLSEKSKPGVNKRKA